MKLIAIHRICNVPIVDLGNLSQYPNCNHCLRTIREIRIPPEDMFVQCKFLDKMINCVESLKETISPSLGLCYTFNGLDSFRMASNKNNEIVSGNWSVDEGYKLSAFWDVYPRRALLTGTKYGFSIVLRMKREDVDHTCSDVYGFLVRNYQFFWRPTVQCFSKYSSLAQIHRFLKNLFKKMGSGLNQDPLLKKYAFLSITWVAAIRMEHVRVPSKDLSTRNVLWIGPMVICASGLLLNPAKVPNFQYRAWLCSKDQKFHGDYEKTQKSWFWDLAQ
jgi:Amiloride-sensitive sodium channel